MSSVRSQSDTYRAYYRDFLDVYDHIVDPNERRRLSLAEIDRAPFGWYHVRAVVVAGAGFFTDAYDVAIPQAPTPLRMLTHEFKIFAINLTTAMFGVVFWQLSNKGTIPSKSDTVIKVATSIGTVLGQIVFGHMADWLGRKRMYGIELTIMIACTLAQALCAPSQALSFVGAMVFWRVLMGIGVGGDYPLSAVITSEFASTKWRGTMIGAVFAMQGFGQFAAAAMTLVVTAAYRETLEPIKSVSTCSGECQKSVDAMWRIVIGFGGLPGLFALYYRLTIPETPRYTFDVAHDVEKAFVDIRAFRAGTPGEGCVDPIRRAEAIQDINSKYHTARPTWKHFTQYFGKRQNALKLIGTAGSWFFLDIAFYGLGLNSSNILSTIGFGGKENVYRLFYNAAVGNLVLICAGAIPGYWCTVLTVDHIGRKPIQIAGFIILTLLFAVIGFDFYGLSSKALLSLYVLAQFFFNFGPNATTFIIPAECYPTRFRATAHGLSAGSGKIGAIIAQVVFNPLTKRGLNEHSKSATPWLNHVMQIFALFMLCGVFTSFLVPETRRQSLEELAGEGAGTEMFELNFVERFFTGANWAIADNHWQRNGSAQGAQPGQSTTGKQSFDWRSWTWQTSAGKAAWAKERSKKSGSDSAKYLNYNPTLRSVRSQPNLEFQFD